MTEDQSSESHKPKGQKATSGYKTAALSVILSVLLLAAATSAWMIADKDMDLKKLATSYSENMIASSSLKMAYNTHRTSAAIHRMAILEESVRGSEPKDVSVKRLALSIAMAKNGTGFEDRLMERIMQNASDDELNGMRTSFLTSLFENYPPALKGQEGIQMQMDAVMLELRAAGDAIRMSEAKMKEATVISESIGEAQENVLDLWRILIVSLSASALMLIFKSIFSE